MVEVVLVNVNTTPLTFVLFVDRDDPDTLTLTRQMPGPVVLGPWLAFYRGFPLCFTVCLFGLNEVGAIGQFQSVKDIGKFSFSIHNFASKK